MVISYAPWSNGEFLMDRIVLVVNGAGALIRLRFFDHTAHNTNRRLVTYAPDHTTGAQLSF